MPLLCSVCHLLRLYSLRHRTKAEFFFSFNRNEDEESDDEDLKSDQSVDESDLDFDEV